MSQFLFRLGRRCARHPWRVLEGERAEHGDAIGDSDLDDELAREFPDRELV
jgi:hypothetical protein